MSHVAVKLSHVDALGDRAGHLSTYLVVYSVMQKGIWKKAAPIIPLMRKKIYSPILSENNSSCEQIAPVVASCFER